MSRLDMMTARDYTDRDGNSKTQWTKIGTAFANRDGKGYSLVFDALPTASLNQEGKLETRAMLREPLPPRDGARGGAASNFDDDDLPPM